MVSKEKPTLGSYFFGSFPVDRIPRATKAVMYISLLAATIPVNYIFEFREILELLCISFNVQGFTTTLTFAEASIFYRLVSKL